MLPCFIESQTAPADKTIPIEVISADGLSAWLEQQLPAMQRWIKVTGFLAKPGQICLVPGSEGELAKVALGIADSDLPETYAGLSCALPAGIYSLDKSANVRAAVLGWGMGAYSFARYRTKEETPKPQLWITESSLTDIHMLLESIYLVRDLINTPTEHMGPLNLAEASEKLAREYRADFKLICADDLLKNNYPAIHTVGRAGSQPPCLIDMIWGNPAHPKLTLVGKGVCFDSGGLDVKSASNMLLMKKDMGGAAHVLGLAKLIIAAKLPVRLRVLIPAVENAISANAYRPGDVITMRNKKSVEVGNTDAEGRLVLADALSEAVNENPDLIIDIATLTGAARVALGPDIPVFFTPDESLANAMQKSSATQKELVWRLPLFAGYRSWLDSNIADINNNTSQPYAGAITAALFLQEFVPATIPWIHFDLMAWNIKNTPGHPTGGEAMGLRVMLDFLMNKYQIRT